MFSSDQHREVSRARSRTPLRAMMSLSILVSVVLAAASLVSFGSATLPVVLFGIATALIGHELVRTYPHASLGSCNAVTLVRAAMVAFLVSAVFGEGSSAWLVLSVAVAAFLLDGLDGWLARRDGLSSEFGARFDMETDAALAAVLALWLMASGTTGLVILILGFMRYAFVIASHVFPWLAASLPASMRRKAICVVQISALLILICPLTPDTALPWISIGAALLLVWSFAADVKWLARHVT